MKRTIGTKRKTVKGMDWEKLENYAEYNNANQKRLTRITRAFGHMNEYGAPKHFDAVLEAIAVIAENLADF